MPTQDQATLGWAADDDNHGSAAVWIELRAGQTGSGVAASASSGSQAIINGYGSGCTELISQYYDATDNRYEFSGNQDIDGVLIGSLWTPTKLTFSFPTSGSFYTDGTGSYFGNEAANHVVFNAQQQTAARYALGLVSSDTNLTFTEVTETVSNRARELGPSEDHARDRAQAQASRLHRPGSGRPWRDPQEHASRSRRSGFPDRGLIGAFCTLWKAANIDD